MKAITSPNRSRSRASTRERTPLRARTLVGADSSVDAIAAARDLAWAGQHASAIDVVTAALPRTDIDDAGRLGLLELRAESLSAQGEVDRALADAETMVVAAERSGRPELEAQALNCLSRVQAFSGGIDAAVATAGRALAAARRSRKKAVVATCLLNLAAAQMRMRASAASADAVENADAAARRFAALGDEFRCGRVRES